MQDIKKLISQMSLNDKVRQLTQINAFFVNMDIDREATGVSGEMGLTQEDVFGTGSVLNIGGAENAQKVRQRYLQHNKQGIPLVLMDDVIHGYRTIFPIPLAIACSFDLALAEECAQMSAVEASANGVDVTFSPMVNLSRDARWGRVMEGYGEDPLMNGLFGRATIRGYHKGGLGCCVKHYAAYGAAEAGKDYNTTEVSDHTLREYYLKAFEECLKENPECLMTSFNLLNGIPVNGSRRLLLDILRDEWGYEGVVVSDYGAVVEMINHGYAENLKECAKISANNQIDLEMMSAAYLKHLPELVSEGAVSEATVDKMVERMLLLKQKLGLFQNPQNATNPQLAASFAHNKAHREIAKRAAKQSFVLLENNGILPLEKDASIALVGPFAQEQNILGAWACAGRWDETVTVLQGFENFLGRKVPCAAGCDKGLLSTDKSGFPLALSTVDQSDIVVACIGEYAWFSGESASRVDISIPKVQVDLLKEIRAQNKKIVSVVFGGRPQVLAEVKALSDAVICVWQPGSEGGNAIAEVLFGESPSGKLAMSFPRSVGQCPIYYNHFNTGRPKLQDVLGVKYSSSYLDELNAPLYPFGYGLSYTKFALSDICLSSGVMHRGQSVTVSATVTNCGEADGSEVVQLYIRDKFASFARPVRELKSFQKVSLKKGQKNTVTFQIDEQMLSFHRADGSFGAECGEFEIFLGTDSTCPACGTLLLKD